MPREQHSAGDTMLPVHQGPAIIPGMSKNIQVRIPPDLIRDAQICAAALYNESVPDYVARALRELLERELPLAAKKVCDRVNVEAKGGRKKP